MSDPAETDLSADSLERIRTVARAARAWRSPEHPARADAVAQTLDAANRFTEEALAFAVNAAMHDLTAPALRAWRERLAGRATPPAQTVAVVPHGSAPLEGLDAVLGALLAGHRCLFVPPASSPTLVPAFLASVGAAGRGDSFATRSTAAAAFHEADAAVGGGGEEPRAAFERHGDAAALAAERRHWRGAPFSVAVLDAQTSDDALEGLAEDILLFEGGRSVQLVWAAAGTPPDPLLEAMARFRAVFPAHPDAAGALQMQKAFLEAQGQSHAHGEGLEFLMSRGAPEVQPPGHLRWAEYNDPAQVRDWLAAHARDVHALVGHPERTAEMEPPEGLAVRRPGTVHRELLEAPHAGALLDFLASL